MTEIHLNINNIIDSGALLALFPAGKGFEFTAKKVFRRKTRVICACGNHMVHNGYDYARKRGFGKVRIGKQTCKACGIQHHEDKGFWKNLLSQWEDTMTSMFLELRDGHASWDLISRITRYLVPCSKDKARYWFNERIEAFEYPQDNYLIVNYDEQHPKKGRHQKFRLTLLNYETKVPIADELFENKDSETIESFLREHLDVTKPIVLITDCDRSYPAIFKKLWGNKVVHQKCLFHLNKLVSKDFGKNTDLLGELNKYSLLNIFYNRKRELKFLERQLKKQHKKAFNTKKEKQDWIKAAKKKFYKYIRKLECSRRRKGKNLTQRTLWKAKEVFDQLQETKAWLSNKAQDRLKMVKNNWKYFTAFYHIKGCPATNNAVENFYSTSLKTQKKKQLRSNTGLLNHMKLAALKRAEGFHAPKKSLLEIYGLFKLIT